MDYTFHISKDWYQIICDRISVKLTTRKARYKFDLYKYKEEYLFSTKLNWDKDYSLVQKDIVLDLDIDKEGLHIIWKDAANSKSKKRFKVY